MHDLISRKGLALMAITVFFENIFHLKQARKR